MRASSETFEAVYVASWPRQPGVDVAAALPARAADPRFAEDQVSNDACQRDRNYDGEPCKPRGRLSMGPGQDPDQHDNFGDDKEDLSGRPKVERQALSPCSTRVNGSTGSRTSRRPAICSG